MDFGALDIVAASRRAPGVDGSAAVGSPADLTGANGLVGAQPWWSGAGPPSGRLIGFSDGDRVAARGMGALS